MAEDLPFLLLGVVVSLAGDDALLEEPAPVLLHEAVVGNDEARAGARLGGSRRKGADEAGVDEVFTRGPEGEAVADSAGGGAGAKEEDAQSRSERVLRVRISWGVRTVECWSQPFS